MARLSVLFAVSECVPFAKTGGLADVAGALPPALARRGHDVRVLMPRYRSTTDIPSRRLPAPFGVELGGTTFWCAVHEAELEGVPVYLLEHDALYDREGLYGDQHGSFGDNALRYALLSRAALEIRAYLGFHPDVFHVHDWQTSLVPVELAARGDFTPTVLTIHNLGYQGVVTGAEALSIGHDWPTLQRLRVEHFGTLNLLKGGIVHATCVSTVSPRYAVEIQTAAGGAGLDGELRARGSALVGILNGIDEETWNPRTDRHLPANYSAHDLANKGTCKLALQREMGLQEELSVPVFGIVSRFAPQKGIDLLASAMSRLAGLEAQFVALGSGEAWAEAFFREQSVSTKNVRARIGYDERLAHMIEAGSDFFVMPSRYEPCGLNQMYSQRYGTPPIVRAVGGLVDTVTDGVDGFSFSALDAETLVATIERAATTWSQRPDLYRTMQLNGMRKRMGWDRAASQYEALYRLAIARG